MSSSAKIEELAASFHSVYEQELKRQGIKSRHFADYIDLPEPVKDLDRALARFVLERDAEIIKEARREALEEAAEVLDGEVRYHMENNGPHYFCEDYGCDSLKEFAKQIRALQPAEEEKNGR